MEDGRGSVGEWRVWWRQSWEGDGIGGGEDGMESWTRMEREAGGVEKVVNWTMSQERELEESEGRDMSIQEYRQ